jgi:hypothetical protein
VPFGFNYTHANRERRKKAPADDQIPYIPEAGLSPKGFLGIWALTSRLAFGIQFLIAPQTMGFDMLASGARSLRLGERFA